MDIVKCSSISKQFGFFYALKNISFEIEENTILGILGPNGAGKTTLIKLLSGLLNPSKGNITINGMNYKEHSPKIKRNIGIMTDKSFLYDDLTIYENLKFYYSLYQNSKNHQIKTKIEKYAEFFKLEEWIFEPIQNLSKGMKKKVDLIRTIIHDPSLLILDEPLSSIDQKTGLLIIKLLLDLHHINKKTIIISTHNIELAQQLCKKIIMIKKGKIVQSLSKNEIQTEKIIDYM